MPTGQEHHVLGQMADVPVYVHIDGKQLVVYADALPGTHHPLCTGASPTIPVPILAVDANGIDLVVQVKPGAGEGAFLWRAAQREPQIRTIRELWLLVDRIVRLRGADDGEVSGGVVPQQPESEHGNLSMDNESNELEDLLESGSLSDTDKYNALEYVVRNIHAELVVTPEQVHDAWVGQWSKAYQETEHGKLHGSSRLFMLLVGINDCNMAHNSKDRPKLSSCHQNCWLLAEAFAGHFLDIDVTVLLDDQATRTNIDEALSRIRFSANAQDKDHVVVYFSGHGELVSSSAASQTKDTFGFVLPVHSEADKEKGEYFKVWRELEDSKTKLHEAVATARHAMVIVDSCHSGGVDAERVDAELKSKPRSFQGRGPKDDTSAKAWHDSPKSLLMMSACRANEEATGSAYGDGSHFTRELSKLMVEGSPRVRVEHPGRAKYLSLLDVHWLIPNVAGGRHEPVYRWVGADPNNMEDARAMALYLPQREGALKPGLHAVPELDMDKVVARPAIVNQVCASFGIAGGSTNDESSSVARHNQAVGICAALNGMGGIGKSTLAAMVCHDDRVKRHFNTIVWLTAGMGKGSAGGIGLLGPLNDLLFHKQLEVGTLDAAVEATQERLKDVDPASILVVIDDVWHWSRDVTAIVDKKKLGFTVLVTSRDGGLVKKHLGTEQSLDVDVLSTADALQVIAKHLGPGVDVASLPKEAAEFVDHVCHGHAYAVALTAASVAEAHEDGDEDIYSPAFWTEMGGHMSQHGHPEWLAPDWDPETELPEYEKHAPVFASLAMSFRMVRERHEFASKGLALLTDSLCLVAKDMWVPVEVLYIACRNMGTKSMLAKAPPKVFDKLLKVLQDRSIVRVRDVDGGKEVWMHHLAVDYVQYLQQQGESNMGTLSQWSIALMDGVATKYKCKETNPFKTDGDHWWKLDTGIPECRFLLEKGHLGMFLSQAGRDAEWAHLLGSLPWMQAQIMTFGFSTMLAVYQEEAGDVVYKDPFLSRLLRILKQAAHVLHEHPNHLASQMVGRVSLPPVLEILHGGERPDTNNDEDPLTIRWRVFLDECRAWCEDHRVPYLLRPSLARPNVLGILQGHTGAVIDAKFFKNWHGWPSVVSCSSDKTLRVWDLRLGEEVHVLEGHTSSVTGVQVYSTDGRHVHASRAVSCSRDTTLRVWDLDGGQQLHVLEGHTEQVTGVQVYSEDGGQTHRAVSCSWDRTVRVWDLEKGEQLHVLEGHTDQITVVQAFLGRVIEIQIYSMDGGQMYRAVSCSWDRTLRVWDLRQGREVHVLEGHTSWVTGVQVYSTDGRHEHASRAVSCSRDTTLRVWDLDGGQQLHVLKGHTEQVTGVQVYSKDGGQAHWAVSFSEDRTLRVWDLGLGEHVHLLEGHTSVVHGVQVYSARGSQSHRAVSCSSDKTLRVWNLDQGEQVHVIEGHADAITGVHVYSADGDQAHHAVSCSQSNDKTLRVWDLEQDEQIDMLEAHTDAVTGVQLYSADGGKMHWAMSFSADTTLRVWNLVETAHQVHVLEGHTDMVLWAQVYTLHGSKTYRAVSCSRDKTVRVWDLERGEQVHVLEGHESWVVGMQIYPADCGQTHRSVSCSYDMTLRVWDLDEGELVHVLEGHTGAISAVQVYSGDHSQSHKALSCSHDSTLRIWDLSEGKQVCVLEGHVGVVTRVQVYSYDDGRTHRAVSWSGDRTLHVWDLGRGEHIHVLDVHTRIENVLVYSTDGRQTHRALVLSYAQPLHVWNLEKGHEVTDGDVEKIDAASIPGAERADVTGVRLGFYCDAILKTVVASHDMERSCVIDQAECLHLFRCFPSEAVGAQQTG